MMLLVVMLLIELLLVVMFHVVVHVGGTATAVVVFDDAYGLPVMEGSVDGGDVATGCDGAAADIYSGASATSIAVPHRFEMDPDIYSKFLGYGFGSGYGYKSNMTYRYR